jgi:hypothetical protein
MLMRLLTAMLLSLLPSTASGGGPPSLPVVAQIQDHGTRLSLAMPHGPFAWNSFVPVTARVLNVSGHVVVIGSTPEFGPCYVKGPAVEVQRQNGDTVFPPSVPNPTPLPCPAPFPGAGTPLQPGAVMTVSEYVILRAAHVRATVTLVQGQQPAALSTPAVTVTLHSMPAPRVTLHTDGAVFATLARPARARGPLLVAEWWDCVTRATSRHSAGEATSRPSAVTAVGGTRLTPQFGQVGCIRLNEWHAVAGWSGFPAANVDYVAPSTEGHH